MIELVYITLTYCVAGNLYVPKFSWFQPTFCTYMYKLMHKSEFTVIEAPFKCSDSAPLDHAKLILSFWSTTCMLFGNQIY